MIIKNFKNSRENIDIKQKDIAEFFNLNFTTISGWETGKDTIPLRRLIEYANHYNFSLDYLFGITNKNDESYLPLKIDIDLISKNLRILRKRNSMTQEEVAKKINTSQANYAHYENSKNLIPTTFLYSLTLVYKPFSIDKLLGRKSNRSYADLLLSIFVNSKSLNNFGNVSITLSCVKSFSIYSLNP